MRIDYCPKCHKANLRWQNDMGDFRISSGFTGDGIKWCHRCRAWVKPEHHEYLVNTKAEIDRR